MKISWNYIFKNKWRFHITSISLFLIMLAVSIAFLHLRFNTLSGTDKMRLEMYKSTLYSTIEQFYVLPYMLSTDHIIRQAVITPDDMTSSELNQRIAHFNTQLKTAAIFILDTQGKAIASREGANKQVISSQADSLIKISRIWADFFPANTSNQPI